MVTEMADFPLSEQVLEAIAKFIKKKYQSTYLVKIVSELEKEYKQEVFDKLSQKEEFDWTGLKNYIDDNLLYGISSIFLSPNKDVREAMYKQVYISAYSSAKADTITRQRWVNGLMDKVLLQVRSFLCEQQESVDWLPFNIAVDQICVRLDDWGEEIKERIEQQIQNLEGYYKKLHESFEYQHSFAKMVDHIDLPQPINSLFNYRDPKVGFYGREKEIIFLDRFLDCEEPILFTAVNGPAGSGKSKFLYEYVKGLVSNPNWKCLFVQNKKILDKFIELYEWEYPVNLLIVIDYAGDYANLIGEWLVLLKTGKCPPKIRIVLLEREGIGKNKNRNSNKVQEKALLYPMWYERMLAVHSNDDIKTMLYTTGNNTMFLELPTLSDDAFKHIIADYAAEKGKELSECEKEKILEYCKKIENNEQGVSSPRPLILLFVVDAWIHEDRYHRWNIQELLLKIINRYKKYWERTLCVENKTVFKALERLIVYATATGGWEITNQLTEFLQKDFLIVNEFCGTPEKRNQLFRSINEKFEWDDILSPLEPDLIGELFVLDYLQNTFEFKNMIEAFNSNPRYFLFLFRSIVDYADVDKYSELFGNGLKTLLNESLIIEMPEIYVRLLVVLMNTQKMEDAMITLEYLQELARESRYAGNEEIVLMYAKSLVNFTADQEVKEAKATIEKLEEVAGDSRYAGNEEIVLEYAKGLVNLTVVQEVKEAEATVEKLREVAGDSRYAGNEKIVLEYVKGLVNLVSKQETEEAESTVKRLEGLARDNQYAGNEEIVLMYAKSLVNLTVVQEVKEVEATVEKLEEVTGDSRYAGNEKIVLEYAKGLVNLALKQETEEAESTVKKLEVLARDNRYAGNEEIVLMYAKGLFNIAADQEVKEAKATIEKLEEVAGDSRYAGNEEIVLMYAKSLVNLTVDQEVKETEATVEKLREVAEDNRYAGNEEIVFMYAKGLVNLVLKQGTEEAESAVKRLEVLEKNNRYAGNEEIVLMYANALFNLTVGQEVKEAEATVEKLEELARDDRYAGNEEIVLEYAKSLVNLVSKQETEEAESMVKRLEELARDSRYAGNEEIVFAYIYVLINLGFAYYSKQNFEMAEQKFSKAHQMGYSNGSINLSYMIRRRETRNHSANEVKEILLPLLNDKNSFAIINMALYLAEYENDWHGADNMIFSLAETDDFGDVIEWWSALDDLEGLLVMTWLERHKLCVPNYILKGKNTLKLLRNKYPHLPDWIIEIRKEE